VLNLRYPGKETRLWYLVPCVDTVVLLAGFALCARFRWRIPLTVHAGLALLCLAIRFLRVADGVSTRIFHHPFSLYTNAVLLPELPTLLRTTLSGVALVLAGLALVAGIAVIGVTTYRASRALERALADQVNVKLLTALGVTLLFTSAIPREKPDARFLGAFASSGVSRLVAEGTAVVRGRRAREQKQRDIAAMRRRLAGISTDLSKLGGADVLLVLIESYGRVVLEDPAYDKEVRPALVRVERELGQRGYQMASGVLDSPRFGGGSALAHATLNTGVVTADPFEYDILCAEQPETVADFFRAAGYLTVLVQPATKPKPHTCEYLHFDRKYYAADFDYRGPDLGWGKLADQYVLDFVHRRELVARSQPRFIEYALITSHMPWLAQASVVRDWSRIGDGSVLATLPIKRHATTFSNFEQGGTAYISAVLYDLEVLESYLATEVHPDTLIILLGDHQPPGITRGTVERGVPVHVLSRRAELVQPFRARGYQPGMIPRLGGPHPGMESFLFEFLRDFSRDLRQTSRDSAGQRPKPTP
jgi:hypothetical protein